MAKGGRVMTYAQQLKQPEWIAKRNEVLQSASNTCQRCGDTKGPFNAHHKYYKKGKLAWEYPLDALECLCEHCHQIHHDQDCCKRRLAVDIYDKECRQRFFTPFTPAFCPFCGKPYKVNVEFFDDPMNQELWLATEG